jgi:HlyD family secretion protein
LGQPVSFKVDAFPKEKFEGVLTQIRMNPTTVQNVVTYDAIVDFDNPDLKLFPGMTAYATIPVDTARNVLKIANGALRYRPQLAAEEMQAIYARNGIAPERDDSRTADASEGRASDAAASHADGTPDGGLRSGNAQGPRTSVIVWKLHADHSIEPIQLVVGITDHAYTSVLAVLHGELQEGDPVVTGALAVKGQAQASIVGAPPRK